MLNNLFGNKVDTAIERLKEFEPEEGYYLAFSGGKDSIVIKKLAEMAKVKHDSHYSVTTIDPPDLVYYIRKYYPDVIFDQPEKPFLTKLVEKGFPLRQARWCCELYKENGGIDRTVLTGIRWAESSKRRKRRMVESCYKHSNKKYLNVIIDWEDADVWEFIRQEKMPYCKLYDEGWKRIGCLLCPMAGKHRQVEADRYPNYTKAFINAFEKLYEKRKAKGNPSINRWKNGKEMFEWWLSEHREEKKNPDQLVIFE